ncbi:beta-ketoacyl synthase N-terminal-like domain-containing protein [Streptomyces sp. N2A]|uniref:beta-ketoacyl synthase N-terminal-like domain-containing protein n=1 Tax=Streptomyces sp. N2A TaxID=3073936 RepID=UPI0028709D14|nr:beta-ketoacyl synthase N-terminal-like domain-containing protein [Streptomyces sp. N2A]
MNELPDGSAVAIVGMACRFPGAQDLEEYRNLLLRAESAVRHFDDGAGGDDPRHVPVGGELEDVDHFDAEYFGIAPAEAAAMDPQQRLLLQEAVHALEHAGCGAHAPLARVGVFCGSGDNRYGALITASGGELPMGTSAAALPLRVSYHLGLRGPSVFVASLCSTALTAVHLARRSLLAGDCDLALAGAVAVGLPHERGYLAADGGVLSASGACRPFDRDADGTVPGSGVGVVVLKRLADALRDGDTIHAVVRGSALNNDGAERLSFAAPSVAGQRDALLAAWADAGVPPDGIGYIEAHGTGTPLGDPVELAALVAARKQVGVTSPCAVGSVKSSLGHLDAAAGMAGLIKAVMAVRDGVIPGTVGHQELNPEIDLDGSGLRVAVGTTPWPAADGPRRAGVSALGVGGTNAHVVLEQPPAVPAPRGGGGPLVFPVSARSSWSFDRSRAALVELLPGLDGGPTTAARLARSLQDGRPPGPLRRAWVAADAAELATAIGTDSAEPAAGPLVLGLEAGPWSGSGRPATGADEVLSYFDGPLAVLGSLGELGVEPDALAACGIGEFAAFAFAGAIDAESARRCAEHHTAAVLAARAGGDLSACERALAALDTELTSAAGRRALNVEVRSVTLGVVLRAGDVPSTDYLVEVSRAAVLGGGAAVLPPEACPVTPAAAGDRARFLRLVAHCWQHGADVRWAGLREADGPPPMAMAPYPFRPTRHWHPAVPVDAPPEATGDTTSAGPGSHRGRGTSTVETVMAIWCEVLGLPEVGAEDDFFDLGGHSLLGAQVLSRIQEEFGVRIPLGELLEGHSPREVAGLVDAELEASLLYRTLVDAPAERVAWEEVEL